jgi:hypothetical protein
VSVVNWVRVGQPENMGSISVGGGDFSLLQRFQIGPGTYPT